MAPVWKDDQLPGRHSLIEQYHAYMLDMGRCKMKTGFLGFYLAFSYIVYSRKSVMLRKRNC